MADTMRRRGGIRPSIQTTTRDPLRSDASSGPAIPGDDTTGPVLQAHRDGASVVTDGQTVTGDGTRAHPLRVVGDGGAVTIVAAVVDSQTILGAGTAGRPLHTNPDGVPVVADGTTITGDGTRARPLQATPSATAGSPLPLSLHGSAFQTGAASDETPVRAQVGRDGLRVPASSGVVQAFAAVPLSAGLHVTTVTVRVIDNVGTPVIAHVGTADGSLLLASELSRGDGTQQDLIVTVGQTLQPGQAYFVSAVNATGNLGWTLHSATLT